jgi:hypothetical protein
LPGKTAKCSITIFAPLFALLFALLLAVSAPVFGRGRAQEAETAALNPEWVLCITAFDVASLPPAQRIVGELLSRNLAKSLTDVDHRIRVSEEYTYYGDLAWVLALENAGKKLAAKRAERDLLIYKGYPQWRYKNELKTAAAAIKILEEEYRAAEDAVIKITAEPVFKLTQENTEGTFPAPPAKNGEYYYCASKKADAFVSGEISEFHGRIVLSIRMYTLYTRSFTYEDSFIFSADDMSLVEEELTGRLTAAISGTSPSAISVKTDPEEAVILVRENYAGQGDTGIREHSPGPVDVTVFADGYTGASVSVDLAKGEMAELQFKLQRVPETGFAINSPPEGSASVYQGSLYIGQTPLTMTAPLNQFEYIHGETSKGDTTAVIFRAGEPGDIITLPSAIPKGKDPTPLGTARRRYYGAWTRFWIALPLAFIITGVTNAYQNAYIYAGNPDVGNTYQILRGVKIGAWSAFGVIAGESLFRIIRYNYTASKSVPKLAK